jgi:hypothetical protein
MSHAL